MTEIWKAIPGFEGLYEVSDQARVLFPCEFVLQDAPCNRERVRVPSQRSPSCSLPIFLAGQSASKRTSSISYSIRVETSCPSAPAVGEFWQGRKTRADDRENQLRADATRAIDSYAPRRRSNWRLLFIERVLRIGCSSSAGRQFSMLTMPNPYPLTLETIPFDAV